jgi:hypothetical protein
MNPMGPEQRRGHLRNREEEEKRESEFSREKTTCPPSGTEKRGTPDDSEATASELDWRAEERLPEPSSARLLFLDTAKLNTCIKIKHLRFFLSSQDYPLLW